MEWGNRGLRKRAPDLSRPFIRPMSVIRIVNARQNNLQGITVELPHRALIVITGPSGSGKSTLAFDTLYAEGQRRYIESLSTYAKQFLERMPKPLVDRLEGLAPVGGDRAAQPRRISSRSTVGTATEVYDYLRLLWARVGRSYCRVCGAPVRRDTPQSGGRRRPGRRAGGPVQVALPAAPGGAADPCGGGREPSRARLRPGARRRRAAPSRRAAGRPRPHPGRRAAGRGGPADGRAGVGRAAGRGGRHRVPGGRRHRGRAARAGRARAPALHPLSRLQRAATRPRPRSPPRSSPSTIRAAPAPSCNGFGAVLEYDESLVVPDPRRSLADGAIDPWTKPRYESRRRILLDFARRSAPTRTSPGTSSRRPTGASCSTGGRAATSASSPSSRAWRRSATSSTSGSSCGSISWPRPATRAAARRLNPDALAVRIGGDTIADVAARSVDGIHAWLDGARADARSSAQIAAARSSSSSTPGSAFCATSASGT